MTEESLFCPLIKGDCKKDACKFWRMEDCSIAMFMETQGVTFFNAVADMEDAEKEKEEKEPIDYSWLKNTSEEDLINEMIGYSLQEFPDETFLSYSLKNLFWKYKGLVDDYERPSDLDLKMDKINSKADKLFTKKVEENERKRLTKIIDECFEWAQSQNSIKLTKSDINAYIMESDESLTQASKDILYSKVNMKLKSKEA